MFSLPSVIGSVVGTKIIGDIFGGKEKAPAPPIVLQSQQPGRPVETNSNFEKFISVLPDVFASIPRYEPPTQQEIILKLPEETKESGQMENGPQVYQGAAGIVTGKR